MGRADCTPDLARDQSIRGFSRITRICVDCAHPAPIRRERLRPGLPGSAPLSCFGGLMPRPLYRYGLPGALVVSDGAAFIVSGGAAWVVSAGAERFWISWIRTPRFSTTNSTR